MAEYPQHRVHWHRLSDGRMVVIRPVRPDDLARMREFLGQLSVENRYRRFQKWTGPPSDRLARYLVEVDYGLAVAFVCTPDGGEEAPIVGDARFGENPDGESCEFGVMIADDWHNSGIAGLLMDDLIRTARARGLKRMEGLVLATNAAMRRFARGLGFTVSAIPGDSTTVSIVKNL